MTGEVVRFGTFLAPRMLPVYERIVGRLGRLLDVDVELAVGRAYEELELGRFDAAFVCSLPYVLLARRDPPPLEPIAAPVPAGERYGGRPLYYSDLVVAADSAAASFDDLEGATFAYNEPYSHSGHGVVRYHLATLGRDGSFFGRVVQAGFHERALDMVASGRADAAAIDSHVLSLVLRDEPGLGRRIKVISSLGPSTIQPVVASTRLPPSLRADLGAALAGLGDRALKGALIDRFVAVDDSAYDDIRAMKDAADRAGVVL